MIGNFEIWKLVAAILGVFTAILALWAYFKGQFKNAILAEAINITFDQNPDNIISTISIKIRNFGFHDLEDVTIRIRSFREPNLYKLQFSSSIDENSISHDFKNERFLLNIPYLPRGERLELGFIYSGYVSSYRDVKGSGLKYQILTWEDLKIRFYTYFIIFIAIIVNVSSLMISYINM